MAARTDTGDVLDFEPFVIEPRDDVRTTYEKVDRTAVIMLRRTIPKLAAGTFVRRRQDETLATRYRKRRPEDGKLDPSWDARKALAFVRALTHPYPGAFVEGNAGGLFIWRACIGASAAGSPPGTVLEIVGGKGIRVQMGCKTSLWLQRVTPPADLECWADEWANIFGLAEGDCVMTHV
jgi:methionyl-tRNA formyltransferase